MAPGSEPPAGEPARVLIVDDEPAHVEAIRRALGSPGERWSCTHTGSLRGYREAIAAAAPDIALLDLNLPDGHALEALTAPRAPGGFPILVMTSFGNEQTAVDCLRAGALDYVVKSPEAFAAMPRTLQRALREWRLLRDQAQAEVEIRRLNADLERRVAERTAQFEAANRELEAFAYSVSHDLRAPLRAIDGFTGILAQEYAPALDEEGRRLLSIVRRNVGQMDRLINDLLALSRVARAEIRRVRTDMTSLAAAVWSETVSPADRAGVSFSVRELPPASGDPALLRQVFANLLSNAVKYSAPNPERRVAVEGRIAGDRAVYTVRDTGVGFDPAYAHKLFGVFQRLHSAEQFEGTGVGLAIVQRIVHRHGGEVSAEGRPGGGAAFSFSLPLG